MKRLLLFLLVIYCFSATAQTYVSSIPNYKVYKALKGKPLSDKFSNIESVKIIYDLKNKKIYYFNSNLIRLHYSFVTQELGYTKELVEFNYHNYSDTSKDREFLLGNLNHVKGTDKWIMELAASDHMPTDLIQKLYTLISTSIFIGKDLKFYLNSRDKIDLYNQKKLSMPCITSDYIFNEVKYQQIVSGKTIGILKAYTVKQLDTVKPGANEIIILDGTPDVLPNVKGIIVNELQTPLSHLMLLGKNRRIPIMAYTKAFEDPKILKLLNTKSELKIGIDTFYLKTTANKISTKAVVKKRKLSPDLLTKGIIDLATIPAGGMNFIGAKAQNLSYLIAISKESSFKVPENAYAIPFYYYNEHVHKNGIPALINQLLAYPHKDSTLWINKQLKKIRKAIKDEPIDTALIANINEKTSSQQQFRNFRFRSSTNAEDIDGFNGAGLYESKTGIIGDSVKTFEKAIKQVWASVWNESSYWEREFFGIDQSTIAMGVLFHRSFPDETANGVVVTKNLVRGDFEGITINVQKGENSVVKPEKGEVCEQLTVYRFSSMQHTDPEVDYSSHSNLNRNEPLLSKKEISKLYYTSKLIERKMGKYWKKKMKPVDLEFKIVGPARDLYIKQVRIFND